MFRGWKVGDEMEGDGSRAGSANMIADHVNGTRVCPPWIATPRGETMTWNEPPCTALLIESNKKKGRKGV